MVSNSLVTVLYGDSGSGKSALAKATLDNQFAHSTQVWLGPDALNVLLSETERLKIGLAYPLLDVLKATAKQQNVLVIDAAERLNVEHEPKVKRLITELLADNGEHDTSVWRVLIVGQKALGIWPFANPDRRDYAGHSLYCSFVLDRSRHWCVRPPNVAARA